MTLDYLRDPQAIYRESFARIRSEAQLSHLPAALEPFAVRLIHACGMVDVIDDLAFGGDVAAAGRAALDAGRPILCDSAMVRDGIIASALPADVERIMTLDHPDTHANAKAWGTTRSAAAVDLWRPQIDGAIIAIGNAPTALFRVLELLNEGAPRPAVIFGLPVGFVGAAEAKAELARDPRGAAFLTVHGRRGGSAMAAACVNALALGTESVLPVAPDTGAMGAVLR